MKKIISVLALLIIITNVNAIGLGLNSSNLYAIGVWENNKGQLKHYLYMYNKSEKHVKVVIKQKKYKWVGAVAEELKAPEKELYKTELAPGRITKVDYPLIPGPGNYMNFSENGKEIGLLDFNATEPERAIVEDQYKYYFNNGTNGGSTMFWFKFESVSAFDTKMGISCKTKATNERYVLKQMDGAEDKPQNLDSLSQTDKTIIKLDPTNNKYEAKVKGNFGQEKIVLVLFKAETYQNGKFVGSQAIALPFSKNN
ncbi:MAG TPA: hypothetical protein PK289_08195 [Bacteroidia bacterium]|jgi:hypothetical protein|nr:hypothetical protein [Bacteroidia bacterium]HRG52287.1 hypothetical protein [Bacteroidia bacterium]